MAAPVKLFGKDLKAYEDIDIDKLLATLTEEELEELGQELIDPDDSCIPPAERCRYKTDKAPSGPFDRKKLLDFLEKQGKEEKDWEEAKPFKKETRGKVWTPKEEEKPHVNDDEEVETEWDEVLGSATEEDLVDLAAILGFHGMLNQVQYHQAFVEQKEQGDVGGGFRGVAKHQNFKLYSDEPPNDTDVEASLKQLRDNDPKLKELNLNNIKNISLERLCLIADAVKENTQLEKLHMSNTRATDQVAKALAEALKKNKTLKLLNMESNYISGEGLVAMLESINIFQTLIEFRVANQRPQILGHKVENRIADLMKNNVRLLKFGIFLELPGPRIRVEAYVRRNNDGVRQQRMGMNEGLEIPPPEEEPVRKPRAEPKVEAAPPKKEEKKEETKEESEEEESEEESEEEESEEESD